MINGKILRDAIISGANNIANKRQEVDELNVFPVPDGDTGTNMSMTIMAAEKELNILENPTVSQIAQVAASALLRGARGNSGVILSLFFRGFAKGLADKTEANGKDLSDALTLGVEAAYKAVMKPTEGTMLTVGRVAAETVAPLALENDDVVYIWENIVSQAKITLEETPKMLPVLAKAGVVDAGGMGIVVIFEGMLSVFKGKGIIPIAEVKKQKASFFSPSTTAVADFEGDITFTYCTEFIIEKKNTKRDHMALRAYLETIGDSVVVVDDETIIKSHVHTDNPGKALQEALKFGHLENIKIENMKKQHEEKIYEAKQTKIIETYVPVDQSIEFGFVAVAAGEGLHSLFGELGADKIVSGGQTMNPSTDDILNAIHGVAAKHVFVLPNNKNIIMAAEQAASLADRKVCVMQTRTIPQGITAMLSFNPEWDFKQNSLEMTRAFDKVSTGQITFAARDSDFDGHNIKSGEILALDNGKLAFTERDMTKALVKLARKLIKSDSSFVTLIYGEDITENEAEMALNSIRARVSNTIEFSLVNGGQPVYYYIISVE
jgi:DAK2 domain fusion protein YloV